MDYNRRNSLRYHSKRGEGEIGQEFRVAVPSHEAMGGPAGSAIRPEVAGGAYLIPIPNGGAGIAQDNTIEARVCAPPPEGIGRPPDPARQATVRGLPSGLEDGTAVYDRFSIGSTSRGAAPT